MVFCIPHLVGRHGGVEFCDLSFPWQLGFLQYDLPRFDLVCMCCCLTVSRNYEFSGNPRSIAACIGEPKADKGRGHKGGPGETGERKDWLDIGHLGMGVM